MLIEFRGRKSNADNNSVQTMVSSHLLVDLSTLSIQSPSSILLTSWSTYKISKPRGPPLEPRLVNLIRLLSSLIDIGVNLGVLLLFVTMLQLIKRIDETRRNA